MYKQLLNGIFLEEEKAQNSLNLTGNENLLSDKARSLISSPLGGRYYWEGEKDGFVAIGNFLMPGYPGVKELVEASEKIFCRMLSAEYVNVNLLSGIHAMSSSICALTKPGDTVASIPVSHGGHFLTQPIISSIGRKHCFLPFSFDPLGLDLSRVSDFLVQEKPTLIYLDTSYALDPHPVKSLRELLDPEVILIYDASHALGLIIGGQFQNPLLEGADVITANTHKTFPGPHRGIVAFRDGLLGRAKKDALEVFCSSIHCNHLLALCMTILEMDTWGQQYAHDTIKNAHILGEALHKHGFTLRRASSGETTQNNQLHVFLPSQERYQELFQHLLNNRITLNFKEMQAPLMRLGTQEVTRRGMKEPEMKEIADILVTCLNFDDVRDRVETLMQRFKRCEYSFDVD